MAKRRRRKGSVRTGSRQIAQRIAKNAKRLRDHPESAVPTCQGNCPLFCTFKKARKKVAKVHAARDDDKKLKKLSRRGHPLAMAYAGTLRIAKAGAGKLEYLQNVRTPHGLVAIAPWGKAPPLAHAGMQYFDDPEMRVLVAAPMVSSGDAVYATDEGLVCAHDGSPPPGLVDAIVDDLGIQRASPTLARCAHIGDDWTASAYLELSWPAAGMRFRVCEQCMRENTLGVVRRKVVTRDILDMVDVRVQLPRLEDPEGGHAPDPEVALPTPVLRAYASGDLDDAKLVTEARRARTDAIEAMPEPLVVYQGAVYHPPFETLVDHLDPGKMLAELLRSALADLQRPIVLERNTAVELLHRLWPDHGERALRHVLGEPGRALYDASASAGDLEQLLALVEREHARQRVESELPSYSSVPAPADLADEVARANLRGGRREAQKLLASAPRRSHAAMAHALVQALGLPSPSWTIEPRERDHGEHLEPMVRRLLEARGDAYHEALVELVQLTGTTAQPQRADEA